MDASLFQFFIEEFGDANCTLMDAFQDTLYENSSFASMSVDGLYCNATTDEIGTCWPRSNSGQIIERPCPEYINGVKYNTTRIAYRECLDNGTWALKSNYSNCEPILEEKRKYPMHYKIALIINYFGHCISVGALIIAFILFLCLRSIRCLRNIIHWNLITTFILRNVMWFLLQLIDENIYETNESQVPAQYHHLKAAFSKWKATFSSPHRHYDCAIELLPGPTLSSPELTAMDKYINKAPVAGMSPFECQFGYTPPLFPVQEVEVAVPSAQQFVKCCPPDMENGTTQVP
ncbi:corticotropin-releasing factor receptor 2-like [Carassius carassius]|uniref:corticotropin-releasing factor receptor 2-like n=1 Tax=Carassius carassius TaxID=217509 RepID=UPI002869445C|nr:corticotropin-releasing factor receptor 2-like [Carassius carassius]